MTRAVIAALLAAAVWTGCGGGEEEPPLPVRPEVADASDWCVEHGLPESMCTKCNPSLKPRYEAAGDFCAGHGFPESVCPDCHPLAPPEGVPAPGASGEEHGEHAGEGAGEGGELAADSGEPVTFEGEPPFPPGTKIRFRTSELEAASGLGTAEARRADLDVGVEATARLEYDRNRYAEVTAQVPGVVREVHVDLGDQVEAGDPLFTLESVQVGDLQARLSGARERAATARSNVERQQALGDIASQRNVELARQELEAAEAEVRSIQSSLRMAGRTRGGGRYALTAPIAGTVVRRHGVVGTYATATEPLAVIADTSTMWALLDVRDADAAEVRVDQPVALRVDGVDGTFEGTITWVASEVDPRTRTVAARAEIPNEDGSLRANLFGRARIQVADRHSAVTVPRDAVQRVDDAHVVFVRLDNGYYEPRQVALGRTGDGVVQVRGEIAPGETVVSEGAYLLKTELRRDSIGAGCCEVEGPGE